MIVFVSYNFTHDAMLYRTAFSLLLEKLKIGLKGHFPQIQKVYDFDDEKVAAQNWKKDLARHVQESAAVIVFFSPAWAHSQVCREEFRLAERFGKPMVFIAYDPVTSDVIASLPRDADKDMIAKIQRDHVDSDNWLTVSCAKLVAAQENDTAIGVLGREIADAVAMRLRPEKTDAEAAKLASSAAAVDPVERQSLCAEECGVPVKINRRVLAHDAEFALIPPGPHIVYTGAGIRQATISLNQPIYLSTKPASPATWLGQKVQHYRAFRMAVRRFCQSGDLVFLPLEDQLEYALLAGGVTHAENTHPWGLQTQPPVPEWTANVFGDRNFGDTQATKTAPSKMRPAYSFVLKPMRPNVFARREKNDMDPPGLAQVRLCLPIREQV